MFFFKKVNQLPIHSQWKKEAKLMGWYLSVKWNDEFGKETLLGCGDLDWIADQLISMSFAQTRYMDVSGVEKVRALQIQLLL